MNVDYYKNRTWIVQTVGEPGNRKLPPDNVDVGEEVRFVEGGPGILRAQVVSRRFGDSGSTRGSPSWDGLPFSIAGSDDSVTLYALRHIWDRCREDTYPHTLQIVASRNGIDCNYHDGIHIDAGQLTLPDVQMFAEAHAGTWHADD